MEKKREKKREKREKWRKKEPVFSPNCIISGLKIDVKIIFYLLNHIFVKIENLV